ncbi:MAG: hypothetical protein II881_08005 [Oscillospiraceae bacterium]|nr:hypothetical protein [Oscillospiraceae bacterium]
MRKTNWRWVISITLIAIVTSMVFSLISSEILDGAGYFVAVLLLLTFIAIGIIFDMLGVAVTAAREAPFHSMASHKEYGAAEAIRLVRASERVSSICNDVVGDISGIVSGATAAVLAANFTRDFSLSAVITQLVVTGLVAGLTIGGKALGKSLAINRNTEIVLLAGKVSAFFSGGGKKKK